MILNTKEFKEVCQTILIAIDNKDRNSVLYSETLELVASGFVLNLNITNRQYYVSAKFNLDHEENFRAAINAKTFLSLVSKITTPTIELALENNALSIKGNGEYSLPLIFNNNSMIVLPTIPMGTITNSFTINSDILLSILLNNSKELQRGADLLSSSSAKPAQSLYYIDETGAITFTMGACVNSFTLPNPVKMLIDDKVVRLFRLFKPDTAVNFRMGQNQVSNNIVETVLEFSTGSIILTYIMPDSSIVSTVPATSIRTMANKNFPYNLVLNKEMLSQMLNRFNIFNLDSKMDLKVIVENDTLIISNVAETISESIQSVNGSSISGTYLFYINLKGFKLVLDGIHDEYLTMCFGDGRAVAFKKNNVVDLLTEVPHDYAR